METTEITYLQMLKMHECTLIPPTSKEESYMVEWSEIGPTLPDGSFNPQAPEPEK